MEVNPLNIFFVKSDSKGDRLLFRYPYSVESKGENKQKKRGRNAYAITNYTEDLLQNPQSQTSNIDKGQLSGFTDDMLSTLFAVKAELCNRKFELKVNDVRFVGHPTLLPYRTNKDDSAAMILINIVFALQASASHSIVKCYYDLSKRLGKALRHEEKRCSYLTEEMKIMLAAHDEVASLDSESNSGENDEEEDNYRHSVSSTTFSLDNIASRPKSAFHLILQRSSLARSMKAVFEELSSSGLVQVRINKWVLLSFCMPHKAHQVLNRGLILEPETIDKCLQKLKPYHGILLMVTPNDLLASIPLDSSPALLRMIKLYSPLKSLQTIAIEADLTLTQVFQLTGHLVYWAKATVIYPLCEGNVYVVSPAANIHINSPLVDEFSKEFPGLCFLQVLTEFSLPAPLWYISRKSIWCAGGGSARLARVVAWLLRTRTLTQLHTYVQFNSPQWARDVDGKEYYCEKHDMYNQSCNVSYSSLNHIMQTNIPEPVETRETTNIFPDSDEDYPTENNLNQTDFSHTKPIVIESDYKKVAEFEVDSANHSFDDGADVVDCCVKTNGLSCDEIEQKKIEANSIDSGISNNINNGLTNGLNGKHLEEDEEENIKDYSQKYKENDVNDKYESDKYIENEKYDVTTKYIEDEVCLETEKINGEKTLKSRLSDMSLIENDIRDASSDEDRFENDPDISPRLRKSNGYANGDKKNGISLNLRLQSEMSFQPPTVWTYAGGCDAADAARAPVAPPTTESLLDTFTPDELAILQNIPAYNNMDDLLLLAQLHKKGYFRGEQHLEEIMYMENVTRSQLMQLLDKFKEVLITYETEDLGIATLYPGH